MKIYSLTDYDDSIIRLARYLFCVALEYHRRKEVFDQAACHFKHKGIALPTTSPELVECNRNARDVSREMYQRYCRHLGMTEHQWQQHITGAAREFENLWRTNPKALENLLPSETEITFKTIPATIDRLTNEQRHLDQIGRWHDNFIKNK